MAKRTPDFPPYPAWSTARFFGFLRSLLRQGFNRYPPKYQTLKSAGKDVDTGTTYKTGKRAGQVRFVKKYQCNTCGDWFKSKDVQVDHKEPAGRLRDFNDLGVFAARLFCGSDGLQVMCKDCHAEKTRRERNESKGV